MAALGAGLAIYGATQRANAEQSAGNAEERRAIATAKAKELEGKNDVASSQRQAQEEQRTARLLASRVLALAAAGGGGATDVTVMNLVADIENEGDYRAQVAMYEGESQKQMLDLEAKSLRDYGASQKKAGKARAEAAWVGTFGQMFSQYG